MTQEQLAALKALYAEIGPQINDFVSQHGFDTLKEGIEAINSERSQQASLSALTGLVSVAISDAAALKAVEVPASALPSLMSSFDAALAAGSTSAGVIALAIAIALSQRTR